MKSLNSVTAIVIAATLIAGAGCKKTPKNPTFIPRTRDATVANNTGSEIARLGPPTTGTGPGIPLPGDDRIGNGPTGKPFNPDAPQILNQRPEGTPNTEILKAETVYFEFDRSSVKSSEVPKVQRVATYLKSTPTVSLRVEGNCDERGTEEYNRSLGERRALAVRELLIASGIAPDRVTTVTYGEDQPAVPGHDESAWSKNRRADFVVITPGAATQPLQ